MQTFLGFHFQYPRPDLLVQIAWVLPRPHYSDPDRTNSIATSTLEKDCVCMHVSVCVCVCIFYLRKMIVAPCQTPKLKQNDAVFFFFLLLYKTLLFDPSKSMIECLPLRFTKE